jgi:predicted component of viral defense system (DUF524 family)
VKTQNGITDPFITRKELRQADTLSCMLFNAVLEKPVRVAGLDIRGTILHKSVQILVYADDIVITGRYERAIEEAFIQPERAAKQMGLVINYDKTKYMELSNSSTRKNYTIINNHNIEKIMEFKHLGSLTSNNNNSVTVEINHKILLGNRCYYGLRNLLQPRLLNKGTK